MLMSKCMELLEHPSRLGPGNQTSPSLTKALIRSGSEKMAPEQTGIQMPK